MNFRASALSSIDSIKTKLLSCAFVVLLIILGSWQFICRSPWADEIALFMNYPLSLHAVFSPLPYFNQAATPLYSLVLSLIGSLSPFYIRLLSLSTLLFLSIYLVSHLIERRSLIGACIAAVSIVLYKPSFMMLSEMKHYGLEILACLCVITWLVKKDPNKLFSRMDLLVLLFSLLLGISTLPLGAVALAMFFGHRFSKGGGIAKFELMLLVVYLLMTSAYYLFVKRVVFFQISNYPDAYRYEGVIVSVKQYLYALAGLLPNNGGALLNAVVLFVFMPFFLVFLRSLFDNTSRRLILFSVLTFIVYFILSAFGVYPAKYARHVIWFSAILWTIFANALSFSIYSIRQYSNRLFVAYIPLVAFIVFSFTPIVRSASTFSDLSFAHNNAAISQLMKMPTSKVRFWIDGENVFHYYLRHEPGLSKFSVRDWKPIPSALIEYSDPKTYDGANVDMLPAARDAFSDIPPNEPFLIFASHFDRQGVWPDWYPNRVKGLHEALAERTCEFSTKDFQRVSIYDVVCES